MEKTILQGTVERTRTRGEKKYILKTTENGRVWNRRFSEGSGSHGKMQCNPRDRQDQMR